MDNDDDNDNDDDGGRTWGPVRGLQVLDGCCQSIVNGSAWRQSIVTIIIIIMIIEGTYLQVLDGCCQSIINGSMASVHCHKNNNDNNNNNIGGDVPAGPIQSSNRSIACVSPLSQ